MLGEGSGKLLSMSSLTSSRQSAHNPCQTVAVPGCGGVNDVAFNPDGNRLAAACRDGSVRLLDWPSGQCVAGYRSYYGAALCVCWSPDGRFVASGGEDDLVAMYSVPDKQVGGARVGRARACVPMNCACEVDARMMLPSHIARSCAVGNFILVRTRLTWRRLACSRGAWPIATSGWASAHHGCFVHCA
jgi:hypothetical protein